MKKAIGFLAACAMVGALALGVVACEGDKGTDETTHVHAWGEWTTVTAATLFEDGKEERVCSEDATHKEERTVDALGKTPEVFDFFTMYASASTQGEKGIVLNKEAESGASTYFGEEDKNYDWDGAKMTLSFDLDLTALDQEDEFTTFVLAFNYDKSGVYTHVTEIRFGIAKTADGYKLNEMNGIAWADEDKGISEEEANEANLNLILAGEKTFTDKTVTASFEVSFNAETDTLTYAMTVADQKLEGTQTTTADIVGLRYLWNAALVGDGVELSNLVKA